MRAYCKPRRVAVRVGGVGTELKRILRRFGFQARLGCKCNKRAAYMDYMGIDWCQANVPTIHGWLEEEAKRRGYPYWRWAGGMAIAWAIRRAGQKGNGQ